MNRSCFHVLKLLITQFFPPETDDLMIDFNFLIYQLIEIKINLVLKIFKFQKN